MSSMQTYRISSFFRQWMPAIVVLAIGMAISIGTIMLRLNVERNSITHNFQDDAALRAAELEQEIESSLQVLESLRSFFHASENVTRREFRIFIEPMLAVHHEIQALEWIPRVTESQRSVFVESARKNGLTNFQLTERNKQGRMVRALRREEYFPVYFIEPRKGNEKAIGFDLGSNTARLDALNRSRDTGRMIATGRITLVQETEKEFGFLVFSPVYENKMVPGSKQSKREMLIGFIVGVFRIGDMIKEALEHIEMYDFEIHVFDLSAPKGQRALFVPKGDEKEMEQEKPTHVHDVTFTETLEIAGRKWEIFIASKTEYRV
jgi:CHASE1-domain containing sensor protein